MVHKRTEYRNPVAYNDSRINDISVIFNVYNSDVVEYSDSDAVFSMRTTPRTFKFTDIISHVNLAIQGDNMHIDKALYDEFISIKHYVIHYKMLMVN